jgi:nucleotide-binding universal stress UspA family protein
MFKKILVCLDGSDLAEQILPYATEQALHFNSQIILFRVYANPTFASPGIPGFPGTAIKSTHMENLINQEEAESAAYLKAIADKLQSENGLQAECVTILGVAGSAIINFAKENGVELIAIATHGRSGLGRAVMGSVADHVLRETHIPVLLIRPSKPEQRV